jgi:hypothetical protein
MFALKTPSRNVHLWPRSAPARHQLLRRGPEPGAGLGCRRRHCAGPARNAAPAPSLWSRPARPRFSFCHPLIESAYNIKDRQLIGAPNWINSARYDLNAKAPNAVPPAQFRLILQSLLADRFNLKLIHETRNLPIYALVVAKGGAKIHEVAFSTMEPMGIEKKRNKLTLNQVPMMDLADGLSTEERSLNRSVAPTHPTKPGTSTAPHPKPTSPPARQPAKPTQGSNEPVIKLLGQPHDAGTVERRHGLTIYSTLIMLGKCSSQRFLGRSGPIAELESKS